MTQSRTGQKEKRGETNKEVVDDVNEGARRRVAPREMLPHFAVYWPVEGKLEITEEGKKGKNTLDFF